MADPTHTGPVVAESLYLETCGIVRMLQGELDDARKDRTVALDAFHRMRVNRDEAERARDNHARTLYAEGYSPCAAAECNCGGWHGGHVAELRTRLRNVAQILISEVGAGGPMDAEAAAERAVAVILGLRDEVAALCNQERTHANEWLSLLHDLRTAVGRAPTGEATIEELQAVLTRVDAALVRS